MTINVGFLGTGIAASWHLENLVAMEGVKIAALCDTAEGKATSMAAQYGGQPYTSYEEMLNKENLDALYICLPPFAHAEQEIAAAERGIHLLVEKPVTLDPKQGRRVAAAIEQTGIISSSGYHWRYYNTVDRLQEILRERSIGMVLGRWLGGIWDAPWWKDRNKSGGQMVEQVSHFFDLLRYLLGEVQSVSGGLRHRGLINDVEGYNLDDVSTVNLRFESGVIGNVSATCMVQRGYSLQIDFLGRRLVLELTMGQLRIADGDEVTVVKNQVSSKMSSHFAALDRTFIEAVRREDGSAIRSTYADALRTLDLVLAVQRSIDTGETVILHNEDK
jgi:myo-inositol 2-dehydrogenase/D-chiro-inositol 1-dehydrogenase